MFTKWRPLLSEKARDISCPRPSKEITKMIKDKGKVKHNAEKKEPIKPKKRKLNTKNSKESLRIVNDCPELV